MAQKRRKPPTRDNSLVLPSEQGARGEQLPAQYRRACRLAEEGRYEAARRQLEKLAATAKVPQLQALVVNDLGVLLALVGESEAACRRWEEALATDAACTSARLNLGLVRAEYAMTEEAIPASADTIVPTPKPRGGVKVAILSFLFNWPSTGGGIVHTVELAQFLAAAGFEVRHLFARYPAWGIGRVDAPLAHSAQVLEFEESTWNVPSIKQRFRRAVDEFAPDYVLITDSWNIKPHLAEAVRSYPYLLRFQALECLCPLNNVRLLPAPGRSFNQCHFHQLANPGECAPCLARRGHLSGDLHRAERALSGVGTPEYHELLLRSFREAEAVLVVNPLMAAMVEPYTRQVRVVTAGMDPVRFPWPRPQEPDGATEKTVKTLFFAGLVEEPMKGFDVLHEACARLWTERHDFELAATADPPGRVDEFTRFVGWQSQADLPRHLWAADVVVVPTIAQEALGRTAVEAMAAGRPVVASRLGGLPFTVAAGATGLLCEPGDAGDLARKLATLLDDPELRNRLGLAGRRRFEEEYAWEVIIERHYRPLLQLRARPPAAPVVPFTPRIPDRVDQKRLAGDLAQFIGLPRDQVEHALGTYRELHEAKGYAATLGEFKTLCFEEAFIVCQLLSLQRPRTIVELGTQHGKSTRRIIDIMKLLGIDGRIVCIDTANSVVHFTPNEAELVVKDVTGRFQNEVLQVYNPGLVFLDVHSYGLLRESIAESLAYPGDRAIVIHDCGPGLCNPRMTLARDDPGVTSHTGVWERHVLAELFGIDHPLSPRLDSAESGTHRMRIFGTPHGLGVILPKMPVA